MYDCKNILLVLATACMAFTFAHGYSPRRDALIIAEYKNNVTRNHAKIARQLVHQANWASVGTISTATEVLSYPMVNIIAVDDNDADDVSTGTIRFLLTDLDFTGMDWQKNNKVTFLFSDEQLLNCTKKGVDPMEPTCPRVMISGRVIKLSEEDKSYAPKLNVFEKRHPAAIIWVKTHHFYLCELDIENIFILDFYGGPHKVTSADYYAVKL